MLVIYLKKSTIYDKKKTFPVRKILSLKIKFYMCKEKSLSEKNILMRKKKFSINEKH